MAEEVGFEPTVPFDSTSFQDWLLKPLGHSSIRDTCIIIPRNLHLSTRIFNFLLFCYFFKPQIEHLCVNAEHVVHITYLPPLV